MVLVQQYTQKRKLGKPEYLKVCKSVTILILQSRKGKNMFDLRIEGTIYKDLSGRSSYDDPFAGKQMVRCWTPIFHSFRLITF